MTEPTIESPEKSVDGGMWLALIAIVLGTFVAVLNNSLMSVAVNKLVAVFGSDFNTIQWTITGYTLASAMVIPLSGYLSDRFSPKTVFLYSVAGFTATSILCGLSWSANTMIAFRIIQGLAGGFIMPVGMSIIYMTFPKEKAGTAIGLWGVAAMVAPALGPTFGGYLIQNFSWRWMFFINIPIGVLAVIIGGILLKDKVRVKDRKFDFAGAIFSMIFFSTILFALSKGQSEGWTSLLILSMLFIAFFSLLLLLWVELGTEQPVLDIKLFMNGRFTISVIAGGLVMMGMMGGTILIPVFLQSIQGLDAMQTGLLLMPQSVAMALMMPISGRLAEKIGLVPLSVIGLTILGVTTLELYHLSIDTPHHWLDMVLTIRGLGIGLCMMPLTTAGMNAVMPQQIPNASSLSNVSRQVFGSLGIAIFTAMMSNRQLVHYQHISDSVSVDSPAANTTVSMLTNADYQWAVDMNTASGAALASLAGIMQREAMVRAIADTFFIAAIPAFLCIPFVFFFRNSKKKT